MAARITWTLCRLNRFLTNKSNYFAFLEANIAEHGFHVTYVAGQSPYSYTVGMVESFNLPELFISSLPRNLSHELSVQYRTRHQDSTPPLNQIIPKRDERFDYMLISVENADIAELALSTFKYYPGDTTKFLQLIYPDTNSKFPHETGYDYDQLILGDYPDIAT